MDFSKLKLIIWDLDETLWNGVISDGKVNLPKENIWLINRLADCGVVNSICSKNDEKTVMEELKKYSIEHLFVFKSINWSPKGERVKQIVEHMQLRPVNCLFVDDNASNRAEVQQVCAGINVEDVTIIPQLCDYFSSAETRDIGHSRVDQYKTLEKKNSFKAMCATNEEFLRKCNIHVSILHDCQNHIERIAELIQRSNQLNFTKIRSTEAEIEELISMHGIESGYVTVTDNFGDYGIVGFFALKEKKLIHYVFSCRTLGMGIEQYVYKQIGCPELDVVGEVASKVTSPNPVWINNETEGTKSKKTKIGEKIVLKGPCDIQQIFAYISDSKNIIKEFGYVNKNGVSIEGHNHTFQIVEACSVDQVTKQKMAKKYPFADTKMFDTCAFDEDVRYVVLSLLTDPNLGIYEDRETGIKLAFGEWKYDLTDIKCEEQYLRNQVYTANCTFSKKDIEFCRNNLIFCGQIQPEQVIENIKIILDLIAPQAELILIIGSEIPFLMNNQPAYEKREEYNAVLNKSVREFEKKEKRIHLLDVNNYIKGQESFTNNINHFTREIYFRLSNDLIKIINENGGRKKLKKYSFFESKIISYYRRIKNRIKRVLEK